MKSSLQREMNFIERESVVYNSAFSVGFLLSDQTEGSWDLFTSRQDTKPGWIIAPEDWIWNPLQDSLVMIPFYYV